MLQVELRHLALSRPLVRWLRVVGVNGTVVFASHAHVGLPIDADRALFDQFGEQVDQRLAFVLPRERLKHGDETLLWHGHGAIPMAGWRA